VVVAASVWDKGKAMSKNIVIVMYGVLLAICVCVSAYDHITEQSTIWDNRPGIIFKHDEALETTEVLFDGSMVLAIRVAAYAVLAMAVAVVSVACAAGCAVVVGLARWALRK